MNHTFCRELYSQVLAEVRKHFKTELIKKAWVWTDRKRWEFHGPNDEFFSGLKADCAWSAKAAGWSQLLEYKDIVEHADPRGVLASLSGNARPAKKTI